jgi:hypothetical protein
VSFGFNRFDAVGFKRLAGGYENLPFTIPLALYTQASALICRILSYEVKFLRGSYGNKKEAT